MARASRFSAAFAQVVRRHRTRKGLSQEAVAEAASIHHTYVGLVERGERTPTVEVAERLARALGKSLSALVREAERESSK
jgi:transcriptional regulator with XRE-family HTH domain